MAAKVAMIQVEKGGSVTEAAREVGYAEASAQSGKIQKTKTYRDIMAKHNDATVKRLLLLRQEAAKALKNKAKTAKYGELWSGIETATKNIQLLTGGATTNEAVKIVFDEAFGKEEGGGHVQDPTPSVEGKKESLHI